MSIICRKGLLATQLTKLQLRFPEHCDFFPVSFSLRTEKNRLSQYCLSLKKPKTFIMKPNGGCQGKGILLTRHPLKVIPKLEDDDYTVQAYIHRPLLIDKKKFDMRIYVLCTSVTNLTLFVHREGLVRIAAHDYVKPSKANLNDTRVHLTNYAVNKGDEAFQRCDAAAAGCDDGSIGNKRDFAFLEKYVNELAVDGFGDDRDEDVGAQETCVLPPIRCPSGADDDGLAEDDEGDQASKREAAVSIGGQTLTPWQELWRRIDKAIILTLASGLESLQQNYTAAVGSAVNAVDGRMCFELLGFDILVTQSFRPYVVEVNHSPSLFTDSPLDERVKDKVLYDTLKQLNPYMLDVRKTSDLHYARNVLTKQSPTNQTETAEGATRPFVEPVAFNASGFRRIFPEPMLQPDRSSGVQVPPSEMERDVELGTTCESVLNQLFTPVAQKRRER